jgi:hypothetical protein
MIKVLPDSPTPSPDLQRNDGNPGYTDHRMSGQNLIEAVSSLFPEEQASVLQFIDYLKGRKGSQSSPLFQAAERFIADHPDILQRLSQ